MSASRPSLSAIAHRLALVGIDTPEWGPANRRLKEALQAAGVTISSPGGSLYRRLTVLLAEFYDPRPRACASRSSHTPPCARRCSRIWMKWTGRRGRSMRGRCEMTPRDEFRPMDEQEQFNKTFVVPKLTPEQVQLMSDYLEKVPPTAKLDPRSVHYDPIAAAMAEHPGLTREKAEAMARAFGF